MRYGIAEAVKISHFIYICTYQIVPLTYVEKITYRFSLTLFTRNVRSNDSPYKGICRKTILTGYWFEYTASQSYNNNPTHPTPAPLPIGRFHRGSKKIISVRRKRYVLRLGPLSRKNIGIKVKFPRSVRTFRPYRETCIGGYFDISKIIGGVYFSLWCKWRGGISIS